MQCLGVSTKLPHFLTSNIPRLVPRPSHVFNACEKNQESHFFSRALKNKGRPGYEATWHLTPVHLPVVTEGQEVVLWKFILMKFGNNQCTISITKDILHQRCTYEMKRGHMYIAHVGLLKLAAHFINIIAKRLAMLSWSDGTATFSLGPLTPGTHGSQFSNYAV